jgi:23S rRNA (cytidine1920-2'-O)/16S rRNA (cytidine1409-2'-O)-methyltransferase
VRIDQLLVERGLASSRVKAQALVMAGAVSSAGQRVDKVGTLVDRDADISVAGAASRFVSRGGEKLDGALDHFVAQGLDVKGSVCVDIGASTGGFTDCLLSRGAAKVYAVDVGYGQLALSLRQDARVVVRERTNAKNLARDDFAEPIDLVVVDASFIGIGKLIDAIARITRDGGSLVALIKPQFEAGRKAVSRGRGVIRDPEIRAHAIEIGREAVLRAGFSIRAEVDSALPGPKGNVERFVYAIYSASTGTGVPSEDSST